MVAWLVWARVSRGQALGWEDLGDLEEHPGVQEWVVLRLGQGTGCIHSSLLSGVLPTPVQPLALPPRRSAPPARHAPSHLAGGAHCYVAYPAAAVPYILQETW